jgi:hypothetical protein
LLLTPSLHSRGPLVRTAPRTSSISVGSTIPASPAEQARDWGWTAALHSDDLNRVADYWRSVLASGERVKLKDARAVLMACIVGFFFVRLPRSTTTERLPNGSEQPPTAKAATASRACPAIQTLLAILLCARTPHRCSGHLTSGLTNQADKHRPWNYLHARRCHAAKRFRSV